MQEQLKSVGGTQTNVPPLRISGCETDSIVDGPGMRFTVFVQGCPHHCAGCHNPQTHDFDGGQVVDLDKIIEQVKSDPLMSGVTFSGGEPFCQTTALCALGRRIRALGKNLVVYSGYTFEQLIQMGDKNADIIELLQMCDLLVDGRYEAAQRDLTLQFRGSKNQHIVDLKKVNWNEIKQTNDCIED